MKTIEFNIASLIKSPSALTREQGNVVYEKIVQNLNAGNKVILDFKDIESIITPFLNVSIGKLYENFSSDQLNTNLTVANLPEGTASKFQIVIKNAKNYYANKNAFQKAVYEVIDK